MNKRIISCLLIIPMLVTIIVGCSASIPPKSIVSNFLESLKTCDMEKASSYLVESRDEQFKDKLIPQKDEFGEEMANKIFSRISYEIKSEEISGEEATVEATITSLDLVRIIAKTMSEVMPLAFANAFSDDESSQEDINSLTEQYLINNISDENAPTTTTDVVINLKKVEGQWFIIPDDHLVNSLTGSVGKAFSGFE